MMTAAHGAFWTWSLEHYAQDGVEPLVLRLQDEVGLDVNIAFWSCWCATLFDPVPTLVLRNAMALTSSWSTKVTTPLRTARRHLKSSNSLPSDHQGAALLRAAIKENELTAEKIEQEMLENLALAKLVPVASDHDDVCNRAIKNLKAYAALGSAKQRAGHTIALLESFAHHIFTNTPQDADLKG